MWFILYFDNNYDIKFITQIFSCYLYDSGIFMQLIFREYMIIKVLEKILFDNMGIIP